MLLWSLKREWILYQVSRLITKRTTIFLCNTSGLVRETGSTQGVIIILLGLVFINAIY